MDINTRDCHLLIRASRSHRNVYWFHVAFLYYGCLSRKHNLITVLHSSQCPVKMKFNCLYINKCQVIEGKIDKDATEIYLSIHYKSEMISV